MIIGRSESSLDSHGGFFVSPLGLPPDWSAAREELRELTARAGWDADLVADAEVALLELFVNAWRHGGSAAPLVVIALLDHVLRVSVSDGNPIAPIQRDGSDLLAVSGRGLRLVRSLTDRFGTEPRKSGKSCWFELDAAA
ncbi:ATP-binding protein [Kitasatospora xanthocidica]|uniref:ATP-binding protein n=1 Tax=Kitasatospora xanthocidica TaxID=83382 RepID=A0A372ZPG2_9ACTN|nr:ATP-binding protein [Kitasatospora xanthocidica]